MPFFILAPPPFWTLGPALSIHDSIVEQEMALNRTKRLVISGTILLSTAFGVLATATAAGTAHIITTNEANKVIEEEKAHREEDIENSIYNNKVNLSLIGQAANDIDNVRLTAAHTSNAHTEYLNAAEFKNKFNHWVSREDTLQFSDPSSEEYYRDIKKMVSENSTGLTDSEVKGKARISAEMTTMVTTIIPISDPSQKCSDRLLMKTMMVPLVDHRARTTVTKDNGRLYPKYRDRSTYILISQDRVLSKSIKMFGQDIHVVGRTCLIHSSVNATSTPSTDALFEDFEFGQEGNLTVTELSPTNGTWSSFNWTN